MPKNFEITFQDNSELFLQAFEKQIAKGLEEVGQRVSRYASENAPVGEDSIGGTLRDSIKHKVLDYDVYIGTSLWYASYVEYGTGRFADNGAGRQGWWVFVRDGLQHPKVQSPKTYTKEEALKIYFALRNKKDKNYDEDDVWITQGQKPQHYLLNAVTGHDDEFKAVFERMMIFGV